jgi:hypothetical protein
MGDMMFIQHCTIFAGMWSRVAVIQIVERSLYVSPRSNLDLASTIFVLCQPNVLSASIYAPTSWNHGCWSAVDPQYVSDVFAVPNVIAAGAAPVEKMPAMKQEGTVVKLFDEASPGY